MRLEWQKSNSSRETHPHWTVFFPGGFQLCVICHDKNWKPVKKWRVWWGNDTPGIKGLTDRWFPTSKRAMQAAEDVFVPMLTIADGFFEIKTTLMVDGAVREQRPRKRRS